MTQPKHVFVKHDFLTQQELRRLTTYVFEHESDFTPSTVIAQDTHDGESDPSYRKSLVLYGLGDYSDLIKDRLFALLPRVLKAFNREAFPIAHVDVQVTASNHGDFFKVHQDNSSVEPADIPLREVSYVYYFHSQPKAFTGGQLKVYNSQGEVQNGRRRTAAIITPRQNTLVLFPSSYDHEVLPVRCPSRKFAHSRFTVNGWIVREAPPATETNELEEMGWLIEAVEALKVAYPRPWPQTETKTNRRRS